MNTEAAEEVRARPAPIMRIRTPALAPSPPRTTTPPCARPVPNANTPASSLPSQSFAWLARSKHLFRHMNEARFNFIMLRMMELRNRHLVAQGIRSRARAPA